MLKLVFDRTDARILGVHIIGATLAHSKRGARICHRARIHVGCPPACVHRPLRILVPGTDACELVHYGMDLVAKEATLFDVATTLFTAVTYHELFKEAALNGNEKLDFGIQWQELLAQLNTAMAAGGRDGALDEAKLRQRFDEIDVNGNGEIDEEELRAVFVKLGLDGLQPSVIPNLIRLTDDDGKETIGWPEFLKVFKVLERIEQTQKEKKDRGFF